MNSAARTKDLIHLQQYVETTSQLADLYEDKEGERKAEIAALSGPNEFTEFYSRLKGIKEFHKKYPDEISVPLSTEFDQMAKAYQQSDAMNLLVEFTDEESYGRYLDLHECYDKYINLRGVEKTDYITYLMIFDHLYDIPKTARTPSTANTSTPSTNIFSASTSA